MRPWFLVIGLAVVVVGAVVLEYPLFAQAACSGTVGDNTTGVGPAPPPILCQVKSEILPINIEVTWTSNGSGVFEVALCSNAHNVSVSAGRFTGVSNCATTTSQTATKSSHSGSTQILTASSGDYLAIAFGGVNGSSAQVTTKSTQPLVGLPLVVVGAAFVLVGVLMKKKEAEPETPGSTEKKSEESPAEKPEPAPEDPASKGTPDEPSKEPEATAGKDAKGEAD